MRHCFFAWQTPAGYLLGAICGRGMLLAGSCGLALLLVVCSESRAAESLPEVADAWSESAENWEGFDLGCAAFGGANHRPRVELATQDPAAGEAAIATSPFNTTAVASNLGLTFVFPEPLDLSDPEATISFFLKVETAESAFSVDVAIGEYSPALDSHRQTRIVMGDGNVEPVLRRGWMEFSIPVASMEKTEHEQPGLLESVGSFTVFVGGIGDEGEQSNAVLLIDDLRIEHAKPAGQQLPSSP